MSAAAPRSTSPSDTEAAAVSAPRPQKHQQPASPSDSLQPVAREEEAAAPRPQQHHHQHQHQQRPQQQQHHQQPASPSDSLQPVAREEEEAAPDDQFYLVSWNIVVDGEQREDLYRAVNAMFTKMKKKTPVDIFVVQEASSFMDRWNEVGVFKNINDEKYNSFYTEVSTKKGNGKKIVFKKDQDCAVYYNKDRFEGKKFDHADGMTYNDKKGQKFCFENYWIFSTCIVSLTPLKSKEKNLFVVISHHGPYNKSDNAGKRKYMNRFFEKASELCEKHFPHSNVFIGGDFNFDFEKNLGPSKEGEEINLQGFKLKEIGGAKEETKSGVIDYIFFRPATGAGAGRAAVVPSVTRMEEPLKGRKSQHLPLIATVLLPPVVAQAAPTEKVLRDQQLAPLSDPLQPVARGEAAAMPRSAEAATAAEAAEATATATAPRSAEATEATAAEATATEAATATAAEAAATEAATAATATEAATAATATEAATAATATEAAAHSTENERTPAATAATIADVRPLTGKGGEEGEYSAAASGGESSSGTAAKVKKASAGATLPVV